MATVFYNLKRVWLVVALTAFLAPTAHADEVDLDTLMAQLQAPELQDWKQVENEIYRRWSDSGSESLDLLLARARRSLENEDAIGAIEHLTALTDHAPDFAEGFHLRATAYFHAGLIGPSLDDLKRTLTLNPQHFGALSGLGTILMDLGQDRRALRVFRQAQDLHPHREDVNGLIERLSARLEKDI